MGKRRWAVALALWAVGFACVGPTADDAAVCQDLIHRLCLDPRCSDVDPTLHTDAGCEQELLTRTGCGSDGFSFSSTVFTRDHFLSCRAPLVQPGSDWNSHPDCAAVSALFTSCSDVTAFLQVGP